MSTMELEQDYPNHLHFSSSDLQNEDLFTVDTRNPSLLHLHQTARSVSFSNFYLYFYF